MSLEQQLSDAIAAQNALTQAVAGKKGEIDAATAAQQAAFAAWRGTIYETVNGVDVLKVGGVCTFQRKGLINTGGYPTCHLGPSYVRLLEFTLGAEGGSSFEVSVHKAHRGMGYAAYYEYLELRGTFWGDGIGGIARRFSNGAERMKLFRSDATNTDQTLSIPGNGTPTPFVVKEISNDDGTKKYALMLVCTPNCGADEYIGVAARYTDPHAKPSGNFISLVKPVYPNL